MERFPFVKVGRKTAKSQEKKLFHVWIFGAMRFCITSLSIPWNLILVSAQKGRSIGSATDHADKERCNNYVHLVTLSYRIIPTVGTNGTDFSGGPAAAWRKTAEAKQIKMVVPFPYPPFFDTL